MASTDAADKAGTRSESRLAMTSELRLLQAEKPSLHFSMISFTQSRHTFDAPHWSEGPFILFRSMKLLSSNKVLQHIHYSPPFVQELRTKTCCSLAILQNQDIPVPQERWIFFIFETLTLPHGSTSTPPWTPTISTTKKNSLSPGISLLIGRHMRQILTFSRQLLFDVIKTIPSGLSDDTDSPEYGKWKERYKTHVFDNQAQFDNKSAEDLRMHYKEWSARIGIEYD